MTHLADIGVTGMGVMGSNLARNFARNGFKVAIHNRSKERTERVMDKYGDEAGFISTSSLQEFVDSLSKPRCAVIMVKAGEATDVVINELAGLLETGDIIVDCGNSLFSDTIRREKAMADRDLNFVGCGVSGGEEGALWGPAIMPGGSVESYRRLGSMLEKIAAKAPDGEPCCAHVGADGAGHFVKMIHNGIEYADMQVISEAYDILRKCLGLSAGEIADIFETWNKGELDSYLVEITVEVLRQIDHSTQRPLVDMILDQAGQKGTGTWTVQTAVQLGVPITGIAEATFARGLSGSVSQRKVAQKFVAAVNEQNLAIPGTREEFIEDVRQALFASKIVAYSQGFNLIQAGAKEYHWDISLGEMARIWRAGCIIRAKFLAEVTKAYERNPKLELLLADEYFNRAIVEALPHWRRLVAFASLAGIPIPVFSSSLSYYDAVRARVLPANLIQAQRDFFGAHTYQRTDKSGVFHTLWATSQREEEQWS